MTVSDYDTYLYTSVYDTAWLLMAPAPYTSQYAIIPLSHILVGTTLTDAPVARTLRIHTEKEQWDVYTAKTY